MIANTQTSVLTIRRVVFVGVPNQGSRHATLPAYLALGIPVEAVVLITSVDMLWDYAATALNATGYLASTCLLPRRISATVEPVAEPATP